MNLQTTPYLLYEGDLPQNGHHILGQIRNGNIIVYQAFNPKISQYAVEHQHFGGPAYSFSRMSWIKPNFLWMMYRAGWAAKPNQECILAIEIGLENFETILQEAVYSSFQDDIYGTPENWKAALETSEVRLQWDPDHDPYGQKLARKAIQLGMKGAILEKFTTKWIVSIEDITDFVKKEGEKVMRRDLQNLLVMQEQVLLFKDQNLKQKLKITT